MDYELWAIDAGAGEAVLRHGHQWLLISIDHDWRPITMAGEADALRWAVSGPIVPIGGRYDELSQVIGSVRRTCLIVLSASGPVSSDYIRELLEHESELTPLQMEKLYRGMPERQINLLEVTRLYSRRLDKYFEFHGFSPEQVVDLRTETLRRIGEGGEWPRINASFEGQVLGLARRVYLEQLGGGADADSHQARKLWWIQNRSDEEGWRDTLAGLEEEDLFCLSIWAKPDRGYGYKEISIALNMPVEKARERMERIAKIVGRSPEQLRDRSIGQACLQLVRRE
jgi:hypothetical protein